jgi:adenylate cyclase
MGIVVRAKDRIPGQWQRGRQLAGLLLLLAEVAVVWAFTRGDLWRADRVDQWWLMARFTARERLRPPAAPDPDIVLVAMDDACTAQWPEPIIAWGPHLADAIDRLRASGARVIALDWFQTIATDHWFKGNDERLANALHQAGRVVMIKMLGATPAAVTLPAAPLLYALPNGPQDLGYANLGERGADSPIAAMAPALPAEPGADPSFAARVAEQYLGARGELRSGAWRVRGRISVPLRPDGSLLVNYAGLTGRQAAFRRVSLSDVARLPKSGDPRFRNKIVIIGATFAGSQDTDPIPFLAGVTKARSSDGMEIQANLVRTLLSGRPIREPGTAGLWMMSLLLSLVGLLAFYRLRWGPAAITALAAAGAWILLALGLFIGRDVALPVGVPLTGLLITGGGMGAYRALREERERREVLGLWGRYQDPRLVDYLLQHPEARGGEGCEAQVTVLFADLKNFTQAVEHLSPGEALRMLNRYLALMASIILEHGGVVDKYLGDGLMAQWGAPEPRADHAEAAVRACLELERRARELTASILGGSDVTFGLRLTLHSGPVVVGWVGSSRLEFTLIGDTVNVTSRLQETAKAMGCAFLISESTWASVRGWIRTGQEAEVEIRGRQQPLRVYEVLGEEPALDTPRPQARLSGELAAGRK